MINYMAVLLKLCSQWLHLKPCPEIVSTEGINGAGLDEVCPYLAWPARNGAAVRHKVHELEVQELVRVTELQCYRVTELQSYRVTEGQSYIIT